MKAQPFIIDEENQIVPCKPEDATHLLFSFANEDGKRHLPIQIKGSRKGTSNWTWNGDMEKPTLKPSLLTILGNGVKCHVWINDGIVKHLSDCTCGLAGQSQPLKDLT